MKSFTLILTFLTLLLAGCSSSVTGPSYDSRDSGDLAPADRKCNPDAHPC